MKGVVGVVCAAFAMMVVGCGDPNLKVHRIEGAPSLSPSDKPPKMTGRAPPGATRLADIEYRSNDDDGADCNAHLVDAAKSLGATVIVLSLVTVSKDVDRPWTQCHAEAYRR